MKVRCRPCSKQHTRCNETSSTHTWIYYDCETKHTQFFCDGREWNSQRKSLMFACIWHFIWWHETWEIEERDKLQKAPEGDTRSGYNTLKQLLLIFFGQVLLVDETHRTFFMETGKQMIAGLMVKANKVICYFFACSCVLFELFFQRIPHLYLKSPKAFLESYQDMLLYTQREETWPVTKRELEGRGVRHAVILLCCPAFSSVALQVHPGVLQSRFAKGNIYFPHSNSVWRLETTQCCSPCRQKMCLIHESLFYTFI